MVLASRSYCAAGIITNKDLYIKCIFLDVRIGFGTGSSDAHTTQDPTSPIAQQHSRLSYDNYRHYVLYLSRERYR